MKSHFIYISSYINACLFAREFNLKHGKSEANVVRKFDCLYGVEIKR